MPLPESSTPEPEDLNPLTDVLYLEEGVVKKITPKHKRTNPKQLLMVADAAIQTLGDSLYGAEEKFQLRSQPTWTDCLLSDIANELGLSTKVLVAILNGIQNQDYCFQYLGTDGFRAWSVKAGLDELHPFLDRGIMEIKKYHESKSAAQPLPREDRPRRSHGNG